MSIVICNLPKAGLGNQLFPLMNAMVFADLNNLELIVTGYHRLKIGPYLRGEKSKRNYHGYFNFQKNIFGEWLDHWKIKQLKRKFTIEYEPRIIKDNDSGQRNKMFIFEKMTTYHDYFKYLREHRSKVIDLLYSSLNKSIIDRVKSDNQGYIGVHIRMGDFRKLNDGEAYNSGHVRTPEKYFVDVIRDIREVSGKSLPVKVFTDGFRYELKELLKMDNIHLVEGNPDIVDLLLLTKSRLIIGTHGSTFSVWSGFLSDACYLSYFNYPQKIRPDNFSVYEGVLDLQNTSLIKDLKAL